MARRRRYHLPGGIYHVMLRGNDGQKIFFNDGDRCKMCLLIQEGVERFSHRIFGFCFMSNHVHLVIQVEQINLSRIIQNLSFRYTRYINWKMGRIGHLFQGRFKSILVDGNRYAKELIRYIHLNPVRAGMVTLPEQYKWSSHNTYLKASELPWVTSEYLMAMFGDGSNIAIPNFQNFVHAGLGIEEELDFKQGRDEGILGDDDFVKMVKEKGELILKSHLSIQELIEAVCDLYDIDIESVRMPGKERQSSKVRAILAILVKESSYLTLEELAKVVERDASSLSKHAARLNKKCFTCEKLQREISFAMDIISQIRATAFS